MGAEPTIERDLPRVVHASREIAAGRDEIFELIASDGASAQACAGASRRG